MKLLPLATTLATLLAAPALHAATSTWQNPGTTGDWSLGTNWDTPLTSATDSIAVISANSATATNAVIDTASWTLQGLNTTSNNGFVNVYGKTASVLNLGSGGITHTITGSSGSRALFLGGGSWQMPASNLTVNVTADQTWSTDGATSGILHINANLTGSNVITINNMNGCATWFDAGASTGFTGSFVLKAGGLSLQAANQMNRLGSNPLTWQNDTNASGLTTLSVASFAKTSNTQYTFATPIKFEKTGTNYRRLDFTTQTSATNSSVALTGAWSGDLSNGTGSQALLFTNTVDTGVGTQGSSESQLVVRLKGNSSTLTSDKTGGTVNSSAIYFQSGAYSIEDANALGLGNSLAVAVGYDGTLSYSALLAKDGITIASKIFVNKTSTGGRSSYTKLGVIDTGSAIYSGSVVLGQVNTATTGARAANLHLSAGVGSTASFTGNFSEDGVLNGHATITAEGGGKIVLSGSNAIQGQVSVVGNTTLAANGVSSTGVGSVKIGGTATTITGDVTSSSGSNWRISNVSSTAGLVVGQTITGTGISTGSTITYIGSNYIEISNRATAIASATSLSVAATTGILSGTGRIAPGMVNGVEQSITVAAGSAIAPGDNGIGALTLDGNGLTSVALLTMDAGASFTFELGLGGSSDQIAFWNYTAGDLVLNNNTINLSNVQAGTYTLFKFYGDNGTTGVSNGVISGLSGSLLLSGYDADAYSASLSSLDNNIILSVAAVPEPATWAMMVGGVGLLASVRRWRKLA